MRVIPKGEAVGLMRDGWFLREEDTFYWVQLGLSHKPSQYARLHPNSFKAIKEEQKELLSDVEGIKTWRLRL